MSGTFFGVHVHDVDQVLTVLTWLLVSVVAVRHGAILRSRPPFYRVAGLLGLAGAFAYLMLILFPEVTYWRNIVRWLASGFYVALAFALLKSSANVKRLYKSSSDDGT
jgi:hypothetical protein